MVFIANKTFVYFIKWTVEYKEYVFTVGPNKLEFLNILDRFSSLKLVKSINFYWYKYLVHQREKMILWSINFAFIVFLSSMQNLFNEQLMCNLQRGIKWLQINKNFILRSYRAYLLILLYKICLCLIKGISFIFIYVSRSLST